MRFIIMAFVLALPAFLLADGEVYSGGSVYKVEDVTARASIAALDSSTSTLTSALSTAQADITTLTTAVTPLSTQASYRRAGTLQYTAGATSKAVTFSSPVPDGNYSVACITQATTATGKPVAFLSPGSTGVNGFTLIMNTASNITVSWQTSAFTEAAQ